MERKLIEVDEEVYAELEAEAAKHLETPNTVLRRLLGLETEWKRRFRTRDEMSYELEVNHDMIPPPNKNVASRKLNGVRAMRENLFSDMVFSRSHVPTLPLPSLPHHISTTLEHTLQMIHLVHAHGYTRIDATKALADWHRVAIPTITIKFTRHLGLSARDIDALLKPDRKSDLADLLAGRFPQYELLIRAVMQR